MAEVENHFTVFIRLPFNRGDFVDPPPVAWSAAKERALWDVISRQGQGKGNQIDWHRLAEQFEVTQPFLLQQAAWLYERQLSQVRAQMRKVGTRQSATPSPAPGSMTASMIGGQAMKRGGSGGSRVPSRLSTQAMGSPNLGNEGSVPGTPAKSRTSLPLRNPPNIITSQIRGPAGSTRPLSRQSSKDVDLPTYGHSRRGSTQQQATKSPIVKTPQIPGSDSEKEETPPRTASRRPNPSSMHRRPPSIRKEQPAQRPSQGQRQNSSDDDDDDGPSFLPFAATSNEPSISRPSSSQQDPSATLRGGFLPSPTTNTPQRPSPFRRTTSERITSTPASPTSPSEPRPQRAPHQQSRLQQQNTMTSSTSSMSSNPPTQSSRPATQLSTFTRPTTSSHPSRTQTAQVSQTPLSPSQQAALATAAGLSPRLHRNNGSDTSPSMGSSFSDLDDASVTQSALEEALMSNMGGTTSTIGHGAGVGTGVASRVSGISQALKSRYFDARGTGQ